MSTIIDNDDFPESIFEDDGQVRYYSLARHALLDALKLAGAHAGSRVLLPAFLCRDLLAPVNMIGAAPCWYEVNNDLSPSQSSEFWPVADIVLMINYFGFPQNFSIFQKYADRTGAKIIEDNAHGFLSRDESGRFLGCRSLLGIFSIRKTLRIPDGAALWVKSGGDLGGLPEQLPFIGLGINTAQLSKFYIRSLPVIGEASYKILIKLIRIFRVWISPFKKSDSGFNSELSISIPPEPWSELLPILKKFDVQAEVERRRSSYLKCLEECKMVGAVAIFARLPKFCVPYAFAFRGDHSAILAMKNYADQQGFDMFTWPDLPGEIVDEAPKHYLNIYLISLAW